MKLNLIFRCVIIWLLMGCTDRTSTSQYKSIDTTIDFKKDTKADPTSAIEMQLKDTSRYDYKYFFSDDSLTQTLFIRKGAINKESQLPEKLEFILLLHRLNGLRDKHFNGTAILVGSNESFSEKNDINDGDYFAADYSSKIKDCNLDIRIDIDEFAACVLSTSCNDMKGYIRTYPDYDVLKKVNSR